MFHDPLPGFLEITQLFESVPQREHTCMVFHVLHAVEFTPLRSVSLIRTVAKSGQYHDSHEGEEGESRDGSVAFEAGLRRTGLIYGEEGQGCINGRDARWACCGRWYFHLMYF